MAMVIVMVKVIVGVQVFGNGSCEHGSLKVTKRLERRVRVGVEKG